MPTNLLHLHKILKNNRTLKNDWFFPNGLKISFLPDSPNKVAADSSSLISRLNEIFKQFFSWTVSLAFLPFSSSAHHFAQVLIFSGSGFLSPHGGWFRCQPSCPCELHHSTIFSPFHLSPEWRHYHFQHILHPCPLRAKILSSPGHLITSR